MGTVGNARPEEVACSEAGIDMDLKQLRCLDADWIQVAQDSVECESFVSTVLRFRISLKALGIY
jgi:hypothetical protein